MSTKVIKCKSVIVSLGERVFRKTEIIEEILNCQSEIIDLTTDDSTASNGMESFRSSQFAPDSSQFTPESTPDSPQYNTFESSPYSSYTWHSPSHRYSPQYSTSESTYHSPAYQHSSEYNASGYSPAPTSPPGYLYGMNSPLYFMAATPEPSPESLSSTTVVSPRRMSQ